MKIDTKGLRHCARGTWLAAVLLVCAALSGCRDSSAPGSATGKRDAVERGATAGKMFQERCKNAGEKIYRTVEGVEGIFLINLRPDEPNFSQQFTMDDPYGADFWGESYIKSFLQGFYEEAAGIRVNEPVHPAYRYVEAIDPADGKRYRYTGQIEEPALTDDRYSKGYIRFVMKKKEAPGTRPRYGVRFEDISTRAEREYWIAGSSLKVIDLLTNEVMAERIGYMWDKGQGSTNGGRSPWLFAAESACPAFRSKPASNAQMRQTEMFVKKSLIPLTLDKQK